MTRPSAHPLNFKGTSFSSPPQPVTSKNFLNNKNKHFIHYFTTIIVTTPPLFFLVYFFQKSRRRKKHIYNIFLFHLHLQFFHFIFVSNNPTPTTWALGQTVEKPQALSGFSPREVLRKIRLSRGAQPRGKVWLPEGPPVGKFARQCLRLFHC